MAGKEKRGLGIGLDALFADDRQTFTDAPVLTLPLTRVEPRPNQPRDVFDEDRLRDLADSIARHGMIQPVIVRQLSGGDYQIIAGERRWRAARMAGLTEIPVRVLDADDRSVAELALVENLQREDLNPMEEARGYQKLIAEYHLTQEEAAASVGRSRSSVTNALRLLNLSAPVMAMVEKGELSAGHARALLAVIDPAEQEAAARRVSEKSLSVRKTEQLAAKLAKSPASPLKTDAETEVDYAVVVSEELSSLLGRRVRVRDRKNRGTVELSYDNADDREELLADLRRLKE